MGDHINVLKAAIQSAKFTYQKVSAFKKAPRNVAKAASAILRLQSLLTHIAELCTEDIDTALLSDVKRAIVDLDEFAEKMVKLSVMPGDQAIDKLHKRTQAAFNQTDFERINVVVSEHCSRLTLRLTASANSVTLRLQDTIDESSNSIRALEKAIERREVTTRELTSSVADLKNDVNKRLGVTELAITQTASSVQRSLENLSAASVSATQVDVILDKVTEILHQLELRPTTTSYQQSGIIGEIHDGSKILDQADYLSCLHQDTTHGANKHLSEAIDRLSQLMEQKETHLDALEGEDTAYESIIRDLNILLKMIQEHTSYVAEQGETFCEKHKAQACTVIFQGPNDDDVDAGRLERMNECRELLLLTGSDPFDRFEQGGANDSFLEKISLNTASGDVPRFIRLVISLGLASPDYIAKYRDADGRSLLHHVSSNCGGGSCKKQVCRMLEFGIDINAVDLDGKNCLSLFLTNARNFPTNCRPHYIPGVIREQQVVVTLLENKANLRSRYKSSSAISIAYGRMYDHNGLGSYVGDLLDSALGICDHSIGEYRGNYQRVAKYTEKYTRDDFELLWKSRESKCPYWDDMPWPRYFKDVDEDDGTQSSEEEYSSPCNCCQCIQDDFSDEYDEVNGDVEEVVRETRFKSNAWGSEEGSVASCNCPGRLFELSYCKDDDLEGGDQIVTGQQNCETTAVDGMIEDMVCDGGSFSYDYEENIWDNDGHDSIGESKPILGMETSLGMEFENPWLED